MTHQMFIYHWIIDPDQDATKIRIYGITKDEDGNQENVCLHVNNFTPYCYIQLPDDRDDTIIALQEELQEHILYSEVVYKQHLYNSLNDGKDLAPFLFCQCRTKKKIHDIVFMLKRGVFVRGRGNLKFKVHEVQASPVLQMASLRDIPTAGWVDFSGAIQVEEDAMITSCDREYIVKWKSLKKVERLEQVTPKCMAFDIEVNSDFMNQMPMDRPGDAVFQISCVITGADIEDRRKILLSLKAKDMDLRNAELLEGVDVRLFDTEEDLLFGFIELVDRERPNVLTGFNILGFDIEYIMKRCIRFCLTEELKLMGFNKETPAQIEKVKWSSSAYKNQEFKFFNWEGILLLDLLPLVKRDYKLDTYTLKNVAATFLKNDTKDPVTYKDIFLSYKTREKMDIVGKYCVQDSNICVELVKFFHSWIALSEMAKVCNVSMFTLYTQGQQIKTYSQVYKHCLKENIVVDSDAYETKANDRYTGAYVFEPVPGLYHRVVPLDFASLYPSVIISQNICYSTLADDSVPDDMCNIFDWEDHVGCEHDPRMIDIARITEQIEDIDKVIKKLMVRRDECKGKAAKDEKERYQDLINQERKKQKPLREERQNLKKSKPTDREDDDGNKISGIICAKRYYRFLKSEVKKGVIPTIIQNLLDSRKRVRAQMKKVSKDIALVYDKEQLAYKVSANSMYGAMGVRRGYLPFMPGAMCVTYFGRKSIEKTAHLIVNKWNGNLVYGDTDCLVGETPVFVKNAEGETKFVTVQELSKGDWRRINPNKEISSVKDGYQIWSDSGFTSIENVVRCGVVKPLSEVTTHTGSVICSNEHSLLTDKLECVTPLDVKIGDKLCTTELPLPEDTPQHPRLLFISQQTVDTYEIPDVTFAGVSASEAFVWGLFFADGSAGVYPYGPEKRYTKYSWAINKADRSLLERVRTILGQDDFKILDTIKSSKVYKLVPTRIDHAMVNRYRELFYTSDKLKKIPDIILQAPITIRHSFFMGYYSGDGSKKDPATTCTIKGQIGAAQLFHLMKSLGYHVSVNTRQDKPGIYKLTACGSYMRKDPSKIKHIRPMTRPGEYIYDIQTGNHHFAAGVGQIVVHNSNYVTFPDKKTPQETWDYAIEVAAGISKEFTAPMKLEFEETIYERFLILSKKRYMYQQIDREGVLSKKVGKKGVILARRDNSGFLRRIYEKLATMIFEQESPRDIELFVIEYISDLFRNIPPYTDYVITKSIGDTDGDLNEHSRIGDYKVKQLPEDEDERARALQGKSEKDYYIAQCPAQVQLAERMRKRGIPVDAGSRIEFLTIKRDGATSLGERIEDYDYFKKRSDILRIDPEYYLHSLINPLDQMLGVGIKNDHFVKDQYTIRMQYAKVVDDIKRRGRTRAIKTRAKH